VSARKPSPGPPPDCAWGVAAPSQIAGSWGPPRPCLVLRRRCPRSRPVGGEAWPSGVSVLYGHALCRRLALHDRARCPLLCPSVSPRTAPPPRRRVCQRGATAPWPPSQTFAPVFFAGSAVADSRRRLHQSSRPSLAALRGERADGLPGPGCLAGARAPGGGTRWCRVGDRVGARRRWKRPFDFPILPVGSGADGRECVDHYGWSPSCFW
jgi:hypothetical protein